MRKLAILLTLVVTQMAQTAIAGERQGALSVSVQVVSGCAVKLEGVDAAPSCTDASAAPSVVSTTAAELDPTAPSAVATSLGTTYLTIVY